MRGMDMRSRNQYLKVLIEKYLKCTKEEKGEFLDEYCRNTQQNRKYVIRRIREVAFERPQPRKKRGCIYGHEVEGVLCKIWEIFDYPCGQRLSPLLKVEVENLRRMGELEISDKISNKLTMISSSTIDRVLREKKENWKNRRRYVNRGGNLLYKKIPLRLTDWDTKEVGYVEMDLVAHCGSSTAGEYVHSLSAMEISSGWWEGSAIMGKGQYPTFEALTEIRRRCPFKWKGIDSDNDKPFINAHLIEYCKRENLYQTRSRPNRKNDNAYIEQKNYTHVRKPLGYLRYDTQEELSIINDLYKNELRFYKNFFQPVMKLIHKERVDGKLKRVYDTPKTPYQRLVESRQISPEKERDLKRVYSSLNPATLKRDIDEKLDKLYDVYYKKKKNTIVVDPYKKQVASCRTFFSRRVA